MIDVVAIFLAWLERSALPVGIVIENSKSNHVRFGMALMALFVGIGYRAAP
jgi:hypothetical protein